MQGTLFLVVGPSGVGKDTLLDGARDLLASSRWFSFPKRVITRPADAGGEDHIPATPSEFDTQLADGSLWHHWQAHGLSYGIPIQVKEDLNNGINVVLNTSRNELDFFRQNAEDAIVIFISASPQTVEKRLRARGRETEEEIQKRLARLVERPAPSGAALEVMNDSTQKEGITALVELIAGTCTLRAAVRKFPVEIGGKQVCLVHKENQIANRLLAGSARVGLTFGGKTVAAELGQTDSDGIISHDECALSEKAMRALGVAEGDVVSIERSPTPKSRSILQKKVRGSELSDAEMEAFVHDLVNGRFSTSEIAGFLVSASTNLSIDEVISLTRVRAGFAHRQEWGKTLVVDKHSMGGIPGNRITPIVIPILAAFGLTIPKTSSRAITSAAGTADMMEVLARVDLTPDEMRHVVEKSNACIAWNGRLTHSPVDDVMNAINRPLGLSSTLLDVSSIMSKKLAAGSSHVLIDMPVGPGAKTKTQADAQALKTLFESVGHGVGVSTLVNISDGTKPIGKGVGPILETRDVLAVLSGAQTAPQDLLHKSLDYAALILEWVGAVPAGEGKARAQDLISNGLALEKLHEITGLQGPHENLTLEPGRFQRDVRADRAGVIKAADIQIISTIARRAGAPGDKAAGVEILVEVGQEVAENEALIRIFSSSQRGVQEAADVVRQKDPFSIAPL